MIINHCQMQSTEIPEYTNSRSMDHVSASWNEIDEAEIARLVLECCEQL
jgi:hypothetical protein